MRSFFRTFAEPRLTQTGVGIGIARAESMVICNKSPILGKIFFPKVYSEARLLMPEVRRNFLCSNSTVLDLSFINVQWWQAVTPLPVVKPREFVALQSLVAFTEHATWLVDLAGDAEN